MECGSVEDYCLEKTNYCSPVTFRLVPVYCIVYEYVSGRTYTDDAMDGRLLPSCL